MQRATGRASARAALAGNPSDGYGGRTLAVPVAGLSAEVTVNEVGEDASSLEPGALELAAAARRRLARRSRSAGDKGIAAIRTDIPREVGLGGSSAIVIATLRALSSLTGLDLGPRELAGVALEAETEELGIAAGPQDRVTQAFDSLVYMDFDPELPEPLYEPLDPGLLPPLFVAWRRGFAAPSGAVHSDLRARWEAAEPLVRSSMSDLAAQALGAREALLAGDPDAFGRCVDASFDLRQRLMPGLDRRLVRMVGAARSAGAAANFAGSGGAIVGPRREASMAGLEERLGREGCVVVDPVAAQAARSAAPAGGRPSARS